MSNLLHILLLMQFLYIIMVVRVKSLLKTQIGLVVELHVLRGAVGLFLGHHRLLLCLTRLMLFVFFLVLLTVFLFLLLLYFFVLLVLLLLRCLLSLSIIRSRLCNTLAFSRRFVLYFHLLPIQLVDQTFSYVFEVLVCGPLVTDSFVSLPLLLCSLDSYSVGILDSYLLALLSLIKLQRRVDERRYFFRPTPPTLAIFHRLLLQLSIVVFIVHRIYLLEKLLGLLDKVIRTSILSKMPVFLRISLNKPINESTMIDNVDFAFLEIKLVQSACFEELDVLLIDAYCMVGQKAVSQFFLNDFLPAAKLHDPIKKITVQIDYLHSQSNVFFLFPLNFIIISHQSRRPPLVQLLILHHIFLFIGVFLLLLRFILSLHLVVAVLGFSGCFRKVDFLLRVGLYLLVVVLLLAHWSSHFIEGCFQGDSYRTEQYGRVWMPQCSVFCQITIMVIQTIYITVLRRYPRVYDL